MKREFLILLGTIAILGTAGCRDGSPIISGQVLDTGLILGQYTMEEPGRTPKSWALSEQQVAMLNLWLKEHRSNWGMPLATPPPPSFTVVVKQASGQMSRIDFFTGGNWDNAIVIRAEDAGENRMASFSPEDVTNLRRQLGENR